VGILQQIKKELLTYPAGGPVDVFKDEIEVEIFPRFIVETVSRIAILQPIVQRDPFELRLRRRALWLPPPPAKLTKHGCLLSSPPEEISSCGDEQDYYDYVDHRSGVSLSDHYRE
jgi:hypothetical protein